ncbi:kinase-like protein, partial [Hortaea werneckii]
MANTLLQGRAGHSKKPGNKARKKLARGPVNRPKLEDVLEKPDTSKLTKFWDFLGIRDTDTTSVSTPKSRSLSISDPVAIFPDPKSGSFHAGLPSVAESAANMDSSLLAPGPFEGPNKQRQIQDAKDMYQTVARNAERSNSAVPPYDFIELIGKGGYGRVYKCKEKSTGKLMAVKIINIDDADFQEHYLDKDNTINSFRKEVGILQQLKDSKAQNINMIHDAFDIHNQLWIVSDYCTGGSLRTLMRANPPPRRGFEEHFLIPIARELATAIKSVHDIGVIHRDIKCANVYVNEEGDIQLGDFGIVGVVDDGSSKRRTIVGTPHYLPREMHITSSHLTDEAYGTEVDIWSYGITMFEAATGLPPYANVPQNQFHTVVNNPPRLEGDDYSDGLKDFIAFCLDSDPRARPSAAEVLTHPYIANSVKKYPTSILVKLIERYAAWEYKGGQRQSLWAPGGAMGPVNDMDNDENEAGDDTNEWNFSTSDNFNEAFGRRYSQMMIGAHDFADGHFDSPAGAGLPPIQTRNLTPLERFRQQNEEMSANRGERSLDRLFKPGTTPYELHTPIDDPEPLSDLPLRSMSGPAPTRESVIDLDSANTLDASVPTFNFDFGDVPTMKARTSRHIPSEEEEEHEPEFDYGPNNKDERRATMDWKFPSADKKRATMEWTFDSAGTAEPESPEANMNLP